MEQFSQEQLTKLETLLRSDNEADLRQGLDIVQTLLDEGGVDDYPEIEALFYSVAADKDAKIQALRTRRSKYENNRIKMSNRIMELSRQIQQHRHPHSHPDVIKLRREMTRLLNRKIDVLDYIELADADLDRLLHNYRIFEEFPITMGGGTGGSVVVQDPMMESIRSYIENRINNIILKEGEGRGMITADNLPDNVGIEMHTRSSRTRGTTVSFKYATFDKESGEVISGHGSSFLPGPNGLYGIVAIKKLPPVSNCDGAWVITGHSDAADRYGPLLYDIAIEYASVNGTGLVADRGRVSDDALGVWNYYDMYRTDVEKFQCDDMQNTLTDTYEDNMSQQTAISKVGNDFTLSSISRRYSKRPDSTIEYFKRNNLWDEY